MRPILAAAVLVGGLLVAVAPMAPSATDIASAAPVVLPATTADPAPVQARARVKAQWRVKVRGWGRPITRGGQANIDRCRATLYWGSLPGNSTRPAWLAGHGKCGFWRWDKQLPIGAKFKVKSPRGKVLRYRVYDRDIINRKSGSSEGLIHGDITLQTCRGPHMTFVYARRMNN